MEEKTKELIAIGASVGAHCQPCLSYHVNKAKELGIEEADRTNSVENLGQEATCAAGCDCNADGSGGRVRWITGIVILIVAGGLVARAMIKDNGTKNQRDKTTFAVVAATADGSPQSGVIRAVAGALLVGAGLYLLATF